MQQLEYKDNQYLTAADSSSFFGRLFPSFSFYSSFLINIYVSSRKARKGEYDTEAWRLSSLKVLQALERTGLKVSISGVEHFQSLTSPCVIVGNHVSMMDTVVLPAIITQERPVTFIIKKA